MSLGVGARLGHYEVTAKIGEGGMDKVLVGALEEDHQSDGSMGIQERDLR